MKNGSQSQSFRYLWLGQAFANIGDILIIVGLMPLLYQSTKSAFIMSLIPVIKTLFSVFSASLSPIIFNLMKLKHTLVMSQLIKTVTSLGLFLFIYFEFYLSYIWVIYIFICVIGFFDGWTGPASKAIIPRIVEKHFILKANSWMESINQTIEVAVWSIGALLIVLVNVSLPFLFTLILYSLSFFLLIRINFFIKEESEEIKNFDKKKTLLLGWKEIAQRKDLKLLTIVGVFITIANIIWLASFMYIYVEESLGGSTDLWGYINSFLTGGILIASIIAYFKTDFIRVNFRLIFLISIMIMALGTTILAVNSLISVIFICSFLYGISSQFQGLLEVTYIQSNIDVQKLPYVYASQDVLNLLSFSIFTILLGIVVDYINIRIVFFIMGLLIFIALFFTLLYRKILNPINSNEL